jgi:hypothetical protein
VLCGFRELPSQIVWDFRRLKTIGNALHIQILTRCCGDKKIGPARRQRLKSFIFRDLQAIINALQKGRTK